MSDELPSVSGSPKSTRSKKSTASKRLLQQVPPHRQHHHHHRTDHDRPTPCPCRVRVAWSRRRRRHDTISTRSPTASSTTAATAFHHPRRRHRHPNSASLTGHRPAPPLPLHQRALTIEEVFGSVSDVKAAGLNPPPARTVLTPRSAEACLKNGVNPEILRIRDLGE